MVGFVALKTKPGGGRSLLLPTGLEEVIKVSLFIALIKSCYGVIECKAAVQRCSQPAKADMMCI